MVLKQHNSNNSILVVDAFSTFVSTTTTTITRPIASISHRPLPSHIPSIPSSPPLTSPQSYNGFHYQRINNPQQHRDATYRRRGRYRSSSVIQSSSLSLSSFHSRTTTTTLSVSVDSSSPSSSSASSSSSSSVFRTTKVTSLLQSSIIQLIVAAILYIIHILILTQRSIPFPFQLLPNERGHFQSIGLDSLAGIATLGLYQYYRRKQTFQPKSDLTSRGTTNTTTATTAAAVELEVEATTTDESESPSSNNSHVNIQSLCYTDSVAAAAATTTTTTTTTSTGFRLPSLFGAPDSEDDVPWKGVYTSKYSAWTSFVTFWVLLFVWRSMGDWNVTIEDTLYGLAAGDDALLPITVPMHRSLSVLLGHLSWIFSASMVLRWLPRPQPFFQQRRRQRQRRQQEKQQQNQATREEQVVLSSNWFRNQFRHANWVWWSIGGYFVSSWLFNIADFCNAYILPTEYLETASDSSVVSKLINPEGQDWLASLVGFIAPCITAPWFEEILYRGFLLPALALWIPAFISDRSFDDNEDLTVSAMNSSRTPRSQTSFKWTYYWSIFWSGILFSLHHVSLTSFLPLCVLGWTWAVVYTKSQNMWTTVIIHAMWNSRIFLASWL